MSVLKAGILILSDRSLGALALKALLESDHNVFFSSDLKSALGVLKAQAIDIVLINLTQETDERLDFISNIKQSREYHNIIVGVTHEAMTDEIAEKAIACGAAYTLSTPLNFRVVKDLVSNLVVTYIEDRKVKEGEFAKREERLRFFAETLDAGLFEIAGDEDSGLKIRYAGENALALLGYDAQTEAALIGAPLDSVFYEKDLGLLRDKLSETQTNRKTTGFVLRIRKQNGAYTPFTVKLGDTLTDQGHRIYPVVITPFRENEKTLGNGEEGSVQVRTGPILDPMTGIYSRETFFEKAEKLVRENPADRYVLTVWDIDRFKAINEMFGLSSGDRLILQFARFLKDSLPEGTLYGRNESDRFVTLATEEAQRRIEADIDALLEGRKEWHSLNCTVQFHVGMYRLDPGEYDIGVACDRAMMALDSIKNNYIYRRRYFTGEMREKLLLEQEIVRNSEEALAGREFVIVYQPIVDTATREITAAEALVRWKKKDGGFVSPGDFIPIFEKNGFVTKIDMFVWEEVCAFQASRIKENLRTVPVSVNLSRMDFYDPRIFEKLDELTQKYALGPEMIKVEVTESAYIENTNLLLKSIHKFRKAGYKVMMDDFGSGFSSLNMLKDFEVDTLKIDMKFMDTIDTSERAGNIIYSVVRMAKAIDMQTVAEGVETAAQYEMLKSMDCDCIQGYFFYKPMPSAEFSEKLESHDHEMTTGTINVSSKLLLYSKDPKLCETVKDYLGEDKEVIPMDDPQETYDYAFNHYAGLSFVLVDHKKGDKATEDLLDRLLGIKKHGILPILVFAEDDAVGEISRYIWKGVSDIVRKPLNIDTFRNRIDRFIEFFSVARDRLDEGIAGKNAKLRQQLNSFFESSIAGIARIVADVTGGFNIIGIPYINERFLNIHDMSLDEAVNRKTIDLLFGGAHFNDGKSIGESLKNAVDEHKTDLVKGYSVEKYDGTAISAVLACSFKYVEDMVIIDMVLIENNRTVEKAIADMILALEKYKAFGSDINIWRYFPDRDDLDYFEEMPDGGAARRIEHDALKGRILAGRVMSGNSADELASVYRAVFEGSKSVCRDIRTVEDDGGERKVRWDRVALFRADGSEDEIRYAMGINEDVTGEYEAGHYEWRARQFSKLLDREAVLYLEADLTENVILNTGSGEKLDLYGISPGSSFDSLLRSMLLSVDGKDAEKLRCTFAGKELLRQYGEGNDLISMEATVYLNSGKEKLTCIVAALLDENRKTGHVEAGFVIKRSYKYGDPEYNISEYDSLTGLCNRAKTEDLTNALIDELSGSRDISSALAVIDVDNFKLLNAHFGHEVADSVLKTIAKIITNIVGKDAVTGRIGGDEFVVFFPHAGDRSEMEKLLERINRETCCEMDAPGVKEVVNITTSIGLVYTDCRGESFHKLYPRANLAMYQAKAAGKNTYSIYDNPL
ncbi:MAG: EAL domain-containing protein [Lachnospiraceae bacterium]|nr:EAL domain-containing protein [Lachnospiraceae bacterium]